MTLVRQLSLVWIVVAGFITPALADELIIGFGPSGSYDRWGRVVARHLGKHIPGSPTFIPKNMPGAGSVLAANYINAVAPRDGTSLAIIGRDTPLLPLTGTKGATFDATRMTWIGSPTTETSVCLAYKSSPVQTLADLSKHELIAGSVGLGTGTYIYPKVLSELFGLKFKLVGGYRSSVEVFLAMERGEVHGICASLNTLLDERPDWLKSKTIKVLFYGGLEPDSTLAQFPFVFELAKNEEQRQLLTFLYAGQGIGRPFVAPAGLPADKTAMLRKAFDDTMKDQDFLDDTRKGKLDVAPIRGAQIESLIKRVYATPKGLISRISQILASKN